MNNTWMHTIMWFSTKKSFIVGWHVVDVFVAPEEEYMEGINGLTRNSRLRKTIPGNWVI